MKRFSIFFAAAAMAVAAFQGSTARATAQVTPSPSPSASSPGSPIPSPSTMPSIAPHAKGTPAPPKDPDANRIGLSGVWEVALQQTSGVEYAHFKLAQSGSILTGTYLNANNKKYPISGSIDGKDVRLVVTMSDGTALVFKGSQEGNTDMMGTVDNSKDVIGFTAAYRPKYKWTDNLSPAPSGGLGGLGGGTPY